MIRAILIFVFWYLAVISAQADGLSRVTECANPRGMAFDLSYSDKGWFAENIHDLRVNLLRDNDNAYDIVVKDRVGDTTIKAFSRGYKLIMRDDNRVTIVVDTSPLGIYEVFQLEYHHDRKATLFWTIMKNGAPPHNTTNSKTYVFSCAY